VRSAPPGKSVTRPPLFRTAARRAKRAISSRGSQSLALQIDAIMRGHQGVALAAGSEGRLMSRPGLRARFPTIMSCPAGRDDQHSTGRREDLRARIVTGGYLLTSPALGNPGHAPHRVDRPRQDRSSPEFQELCQRRDLSDILATARAADST